MHPPTPYLLRNTKFWLTAERCLFWEDEQILIVSDLHFGKTGHFRKAGIAVPPSVYKEDLQRLFQQVQYFKPRELIFVGDLFHSRANLEHDWFKKWRNDIPLLRMHLVMGNHDILKAQDYADLDLIIHDQRLEIGEFCFVHDLQWPGMDYIEGDVRIPDPVANIVPHPDRYFISGHIHPGIRLYGAGKQSLRFPCFYFTSSFAVLPAFSRFTGLAMIEPKDGDDVFAIVENKLILVS